MVLLCFAIDNKVWMFIRICKGAHEVFQLLHMHRAHRSAMEMDIEWRSNAADATIMRRAGHALELYIHPMAATVAVA